MTTEFLRHEQTLQWIEDIVAGWDKLRIEEQEEPRYSGDADKFFEKKINRVEMGAPSRPKPVTVEPVTAEQTEALHRAIGIHPR